MQYPLKEKIGPPELLVGRVKEFANFNQWLNNIPRMLSKSRVILAQRKSAWGVRTSHRSESKMVC